MPETATELSFGDGEYTFWLGLPQIVELERKTGGKSVFTIYDQLGAGLALDGDTPVYVGGGAAMVTDIRETIRLGLIGGNSGIVDGALVDVGAIRARELVDAYVFPAISLTSGIHVAWAILHAAITGVSLKKKADPINAPKSPNRSAKAK